MMKKPLIAGIMLVVAHTAGAAQGDDTDLQQIYTEAGIQGICSAGMLAVPEEARDEVVPQNVRHLLVQCAYFDEQQLRRRAGCRYRRLTTGVTAMRSLICRQTRYLMRSGCQRGVTSGHSWHRPTRPRRKKGTGGRGRTAGTKPDTEHGSAAD
jgi:hypothetical protein